MRHHSKHVSLRIQNSRNIAQRTVGISFWPDLPIRRGIAESDAIFCLEPLEFVWRAEVVTFHVADGNLQHIALCQLIGKGAVRSLDAQMDLVATISQARVTHPRTR